jgi:serine phosphatase RsbU (regulator of sigma subunit)
MAAVKVNVVEHSSAVLPQPGQTESGDRYTVLPIPGGVLAAVVDGLGHGPEAAVAAERAITTIESFGRKAGETLPDLVQRCHTALSGTRGVVMSLAAFDAGQRTLTWIGVGDVAGRLLLKTSNAHYAQETLLLRPGMVGRQLPPLKTSTARIERGDMLIFATDGINPEFAEDVYIDSQLDAVAQRIISAYGKRTDDALALVVRYQG